MLKSAGEVIDNTRKIVTAVSDGQAFSPSANRCRVMIGYSLERPEGTARAPRDHVASGKHPHRAIAGRSRRRAPRRRRAEAAATVALRGWSVAYVRGAAPAGEAT